ncbi:hypothetical protein [Neobacillus sp. SuZ13]|uniref:hypothetical protein n=1 Tax=Neobacillus sp. SuZ13 TaxID=3047875 RepID=UPI0024C0AE4E|nr:hypothetical protein [Neobacillus sp. SuZ13]WHY69455.1 hypothetical protein QNH17_12780 [Neobacillus sp. SuZ13]
MAKGITRKYRFLRTKLVKRSGKVSAKPVLTDKTRQATEESVRNTGSYGQNPPSDRANCPQNRFLRTKLAK